MATHIISQNKKRRGIFPQSGEKFNRWTLLEFEGWRGTAQIWKAKCECGTIKSVRLNDLRQGKNKGCRRCHEKDKTTHGKSHAPEYTTYYAMKERCYNPNSKHFKNYGGRGIKICDRWLESFENFFADVGPKPSADCTIDRWPNNDGNYEPGNVRWAPKREQIWNRRSTIFVEIEGQKVPLMEACKIMGINYQTVRYRLKIGMPINEALKRGR